MDFIVGIGGLFVGCLGTVQYHNIHVTCLKQVTVVQERKLVPPYRDSRLTFLLKHALGGDSLTAVRACGATATLLALR